MRRVPFYTLFLTMFKIGLFTFGGGYAMIALIREELVVKREWMTEDEFLDMIAMAESTPGPIAVNTATYLGYRLGGFFGAVCATLGVVLPSFSIIFAISLFFDAFLANPWVGYAFRGIQAAVVYLILSAGVKMFKKVEKKPLPLVLFGATLALMVTFSLLAVKFSTVLYILASALVALAVFFFTKKEARE